MKLIPAPLVLTLMLPHLASSALNRTVVAMISGGVSLLLLGAAGQSTGSASKQSKDVDLLGICSFDSSMLTCWSPNGRRDASLQRQVDRVLRSQSAQSFQYHYGMKNRLLVFGMNERGQFTLNSPGTTYSNIIEDRNDDLGPILRIMTITTDPDRKVGSISGTVQTSESAGNAAGPLREKSEFTLGPGRVAIGVASIQTSQEPNATDPNATPVTRKSYVYPLTITAPEGIGLDLRATAIDLENKVIVNVDPSGRPIPAVPPTPNRYQGYYGYNVLSIGWTGSNRANSVLNTTIDPAFIREIRWSATLNRRFEFKDFSLDLKR